MPNVPRTPSDHDRHRRAAEAPRGRCSSRRRRGSRSARASRPAARPRTVRTVASRSTRSDATAATTSSRPAVGIADPPGDDADDDRDREAARHDEDELPEVEDVVHPSILPVWATRRVGGRGTVPTGRLITLSLRAVSPSTHAPADTSGSMRLALVFLCLLALAVPAGWAATRPAGSLSIEDGRGTIVLQGKGIVIGRLERGDVRIVDLTPIDQWSPRVNGIPRGRTVWTRGKDINFYVPGGRYKITVHGDGVSISARGQGLAGLDGEPDAAGDTGTFAVGDSATVPLAAEPSRRPFGPPETATQSARSRCKP